MSSQHGDSSDDSGVDKTEGRRGSEARRGERRPRRPEMEVVLEECSGTVKWFSLYNGYGFITRSDGEGDVFIHHKSIPYKFANKDHVRRSVGEGETLHFKVVKGQKGLEARNISGPDGQRVKGHERALTKEELEKRRADGTLKPRRPRRPKKDKEEETEVDPCGEEEAKKDRRRPRYRRKSQEEAVDAVADKLKSTLTILVTTKPKAIQSAMASSVRCSECDMVLGNPGALYRHSTCHSRTTAAAFKCSECSFSVTKSWKLKRHMQKAHPNAFSNNNTPKRSVKKKTPKKPGKLVGPSGDEKEDTGEEKTPAENVVCEQEELDRNGLECESPEDEPATAEPRVSKHNLRKRRSIHSKLPKNVRAKQKRREASETSQTEEETAPPDNGTGVHTEAAGDGPTSSGVGESGRWSQDLPPALHLAALKAQKAAIHVNLAQVEQQIKNLEYVELIKTLAP